MSARLEHAAALAFVLLLAGGGSTALAGEVVITLVEPDGGELRHQEVQLTRRPPLSRSMGPGRRTIRTDSDGVARFERVPPGVWDVRVPLFPADGFVSPRRNPIRPEPVVTLATPDAKASLKVVLDRGTLLHVSVPIDVSDEVRTSLLLHHVDTGFETELPLHRGGQGIPEGEVVLARGRWRASLRIPAGYLLVDVVLDGWSLPGAEARLLGDPERPELDLAFHLSGRARVLGMVADPDGCGPGVVARLIEPGPWLEAANARGGSNFQEIETRVNDACEYEQVLPDGTWLLRPLGDDVDSEPAETELVIAQGGIGRADFSLQRRSGEGGGVPNHAGLYLRVWGPGGDRLDGALVEVWRPEELEPSRTVRTNRFGLASMSRLLRGPLRIVAGAPSFLDVEREVEEATWAVPMEDFKGRRRNPEKIVDLRLEEAPSLGLEAVDQQDQALTGLRIRIEALDEPRGLLVDAELAEHRRTRDLRTNAKGRARVRGLYPGHYRVRADLLGERASTHLVRIGHDGSVEPREIEVELPDTGEVTLDLKAARAGRISVPLGCEGGLTLPTTLDLRVVQALTHDERPPETQLLEEALLTIDDAPFSGQRADVLWVGPLEGGAWLLALRPAGFDRWTWYPGGEDAAEADVIFLDSDEDTPLERIEIDCGPLFSVRLLPEGELPLPDLSRSEVEASWVPRDVQRLHLGKGGSLLVERRPDSLHLRGAEPGLASAKVEISHPLLAPEAISFDLAELELELGERRLLEASVRVLGALEFEAESAGLLLLTPPAGAPRELAVEAGPVLVPRVSPGIWTVRLQAPGEQGAVLRTWHDIVVQAGRITKLPPLP